MANRDNQWNGTPQWSFAGGVAAGFCAAGFGIGAYYMLHRRHSLSHSVATKVNGDPRLRSDDANDDALYASFLSLNCCGVDEQKVADMICACVIGNDAESIEKILGLLAKRDKKEALQSIIKKTSSIAVGWTAAHLAAGEGNVAILRMLLQWGADIEEKRAPHDVSPLWDAAYSGRVSAIEFLCAQGADVNSRCARKSTPLIAAAQKGKTDAVRTLIRLGASVDAQASEGSTALFMASRGGHEEAVRVLVQEGSANVHLARANGTTCLRIAKKHGHFGVVDILEKSGAVDE